MIKLKYGLLLLMMLNIIGLNAQRLVEIDNQWNIVVYPTFSPNTSSYSVRIGEDTIVNNILYNKVYFSNDSLNTNWQSYNRYLRQDSTKKVFYKEGNADEVLLYDFSLEINDTFQIEDYCTLIVNGIDSVTLNNGEIRKRIKLGLKDEPTWGVEYWIDGIGSNFGVLSHFMFCATDYSDVLLCFYSNSELLYPAEPPSCFITSVKELNRNDIKVFPNPSHDILIIEDSELNLESFIIYDLSGKIVKKGKLHNNRNNIRLNGMKGSIYILILQDKEGALFSQKLIIQ